MKNWTPTRKYLLILGLCLLVAPLIGLANYVFLVNSHEFEDIDTIVKNQLQNGALYYSAIHNIHYPYKLSLFKQLKPKIVAMGSSRVFMIRSCYLNTSFANLGGTVQSLGSAIQLLKEVVAIQKPEVVILGLDPWWFGSQKIPEPETQQENGTEFSPDMLFLPSTWLVKGKVSLPYFFQVLLTGKSPNPFPTIGVFAGIYLEGFYKDGSFYPLGRAVGKRKDIDHVKFAPVYEKIKKGAGAYNYDRSINQDRLKEFTSLVQFAKQENIHLISFLTPIPGRILDLMRQMGDKYAYIDELKETLPEVCEPYYEFLDPRSFGSCDCEFLDGDHGGEIAYLRIIQKIGQDPASGLGPFLNLDLVATDIQQYRGRTMVPPPFYKQPYIEPDFLELGCKKN